MFNEVVHANEALILEVSFAMAFIASLGRSVLTKKPPQIFSKIVDAIVMGIFSVPVTGIAYFEHGMTMWECWVCSFVFGTLGFLTLRSFVSHLLPDLKDMLMYWLNKGR